MLLLLLGLALWVGAHVFTRLAPDARASLTERMGDASKAPFALLLVLSVVLMVIGYRSADTAVFWGRSGALVGINNLLMAIALYVYASGMAKTRRNWLGVKLRHPQLIGFSIWAVAHLVVNGDVASLVLFGGLLIWALAEMALINAQEPDWTRAEYGGRKKEIVVVLITLVLLAVIMAIHNWLGVRPWG